MFEKEWPDCMGIEQIISRGMFERLKIVREINKRHI